MNHYFIKYCIEPISLYHPLNIVDVVTIVAFLSTILFFTVDNYIKSKNKLENYINRLLSLKFELSKNKNIISKWIGQLESDLNLGNKIIYFRYDTLVSEHIVSSGELLDSNILRNLDAIISSEKQINLILDGILKIGEISHVDSKDMADLFKGRIISSSKLVIKKSKELNNYYPKVINDLSAYIEKQRSKKFLFIKNYKIDIKNIETDESFWEDSYIR